MSYFPTRPKVSYSARWYLEGQVRLVKVKLAAQVRMGGKLGGPEAKPPSLGHGAPRFTSARRTRGSGGLPPVQQVRLGQLRLNQQLQAMAYKGVRRACPPVQATAYKGGSGGLAPRFRPQRLELTNFVTGSVMFFMVFHAFRNLLYIPHPKPPLSQQVPLACWWFPGVFPHILLILEHKIGCFVVILMGFFL